MSSVFATLSSLLETLDWKSIFTASVVGYYSWDVYVLYRQYKFIGRPSSKLAQKLTGKETIEKSKAYEKDNLKFQIFRRVERALWTLSFGYFGLYSYFWKQSELLVSFLPARFSGVITTSLAYFLLETVVGFIRSQPWSIYKIFVIEEKHGFNKYTFGAYLADQLKGIAFNLVLSGTFIALGLNVVEWAGDSFVTYLSLVGVVGIVTIYTLFPTVVLPLFYKLTPLEDEKLKAAVTQFTIEQGFPSKSVSVIDGSKKSSHSNAMLVGLPWTKKIIFFDTILKDTPTEQVLAILAHEVGHWKSNDLWKQASILLGTFSANIYGFSFLYKNQSLYSLFGFEHLQPFYIGFTLFLEIALVGSVISRFVLNIGTRQLEYNADAYAVKSGYKDALGEALIKLKKDNLLGGGTDWLYSMYMKDHPNLQERLEAIGYKD